MSMAAATAVIAPATAGTIYSAEMVRQHAARSQPQPRHRPNEALKHLLKLSEQNSTTVGELLLDVAPALLHVRECTHDRGGL